MTSLGRSPRRASGLGIWLAAVLWLSCAASVQKRVNAPPSLRISAIAVYPFAFRWPEPPYRWFDLSMRLVGITAKQTDPLALVFGPPEFRVYRLEDDNVWAASDLATLLPKYRIMPEETVVLRTWAEKRQASLANEVSDSAGRAKGNSAHHELTYIGHVEVVHPSSRQVLVEVHGKMPVDMLASKPDESDPAPELTKLIESLTVEALESLRDHLHLRSLPRRIPIQTALVPPETVTLPDGRPALEPPPGPNDALERELYRLSRIRYANPSLADRDATRLLKYSDGLLVISSSTGSLNPGDLIQKIDGQPAFPQTLQRARFATAPVWVEIKRPDGALLAVPLDKPLEEIGEQHTKKLIDSTRR